MDKIDLLHYNRSEKYVRAIKKQYGALIEEISRLAVSYGVDVSKPFDFSDYPQLQKEVDKLLKDFADNMVHTIDTGRQNEWHLGIKKVSEYLPFNLKRSSENGAKNTAFVSDRVWKYTEQYKRELEMALDLGIGRGQSANGLAREIKQYLNEPDRLFRRVRDKHGNLHLSKKAKEYHPGQGVYRSSFKNAQRLARTETNRAYHEAIWRKYNEFDFVVGYEVRLSNNPKHCPFCSAMAGRYPKDFKFTGWHPNCRCSTIPIMAKDIDNIKEEEKIEDIPNNLKNWIEENREKIRNAKSVPWFMRDNEGYVQVVEKKTSLFKNALDELKEKKIEYNKVQTLKQKLTDEEIISRIGGGDLTDGSCASLCLAYVGNKNGLDVLDFRGGKSRKFFASRINDILKRAGAFVEKDYNDFKAVNRLLNNGEIGKEYILTTGKHASIIKKSKEKGWEYLELQSPIKNGYEPLTNYSLKKRFKCQKSHTSYGMKLTSSSCLIKIDDLYSDDLKDLLGYINTEAQKQMKGIEGKIK
ncbi:MAG: minor capsid protein [Flavobacteriaceae bacterium]|nr:minor capsid protein [Flavobacteriaceae bacterium]